MRAKKNAGNYLDKIPATSKALTWETGKDGIVTLAKQNKGIFNRAAQLLLKKPKVSYIHLDDFGSFVWTQIDGVRDITSLGVSVEAHFGEKAQPLYERLAKFFQILDSYGFIEWIESPR